MTQTRTQTVAHPPVIPQTLPGPETDVVRPRRLPFPLGMVGLWFLPETTGPHLLAAPITSALKAQLVALVLAFGLLATLPPVLPDLSDFLDMGPYADARLPQPAFSATQRIRAILAFAVQAGVTTGDYTLLAIPLAYAGILLASAILALCLLPWTCAGDTPVSLARRSAKLALWSSTLLVPLAAVVAAVNAAFAPRPEELKRFCEPGVVRNMVVVLCITWLLWIITRATARYAGPAEGPGFEPITPRCLRCGYPIHSLPRAANCPECGTSLDESLPADLVEYRRPPFIDTLHQLTCVVPRVVAAPGAFFRSLPIRISHLPAKEFFLRNAVTFLLAAAILDAALRYYQVSERFFEYAAVGFLVCAGLGCLAVLRLFLAYRSIDNRLPAIAMFFSSALLWSATVLTILSCAVINGLESRYAFLEHCRDVLIRRLPSHIRPILYIATTPAIAAAIAIAAAVIWWALILRRAVRAKRFANA